MVGQINKASYKNVTESGGGKFMSKFKYAHNIWCGYKIWTRSSGVLQQGNIQQYKTWMK